MKTIYGIYLARNQQLPASNAAASIENEAGAGKKRKKRNLPDQKDDSVAADRIIRVQGMIRCNKHSESQIPEIRLSGLWLGRLGFHAGARVRVKVMCRKLEIQVEEEESDDEDPVCSGEAA